VSPSEVGGDLEVRRLLVDLLASLFASGEELRQFLSLGPDGEQFRQRIAAQAPLRDVAFQAVELLISLGGLDGALVARLVQERPKRADEICDIAVRLGRPGRGTSRDRAIAGGGGHSRGALIACLLIGIVTGAGGLLVAQLAMTTPPKVAEVHCPTTPPIVTDEPHGSTSEGSTGGSDTGDSKPASHAIRIEVGRPLTPAAALAAFTSASGELRHCAEDYFDKVGAQPEYEIRVATDDAGTLVVSVPDQQRNSMWPCFSRALASAAARSKGKWRRRAPAVPLELQALLSDRGG
jgi:hypothetical protein